MNCCRWSAWLAGLSERAGSDGAPLFVPVDESSAWARVPFGSERAAGQAFFEDAVADATPATCISIGELGRGVEGFRRTHQQALRAQAVALAATRGSPGHGIRRHPPIALMSSDLDGARSWVQEVLGDLAIDDEPHARLRDPSRVPFHRGKLYGRGRPASPCTRTRCTTASRRRRRFSRRPVRTEERLEVELALLACHWLGPAVLSSRRPGKRRQTSVLTPSGRRRPLVVGRPAPAPGASSG